MFFVFLILFLVGYFVIWPVVKGAIAFKNLKKQFRQTFESSDIPGKGRRQQPYGNRRRKIIDADVGEYVKYEDVKEGTSSYTETINDNSSSQSLTESQVSDVEWEDI